MPSELNTQKKISNFDTDFPQSRTAKPLNPAYYGCANYEQIDNVNSTPIEVASIYDNLTPPVILS